MRVVVAFVVAVVTMAYGLVTGFKVDPVKAAWSGRADPEDGVSQILTCNFDELDSASTGYVELFQGDTGTGSQYKLDIYEYPDGTPVASDQGQHASSPQSWLRFSRVAMKPGQSFTKGKKYEFRFTRSGSDSAA